MEGKLGRKDEIKEAMKNRVRCGSVGSIEEMWKKKREQWGEGSRREKFLNKIKNKTPRLPERKRQEREKKGKGMMRDEEDPTRKWREEMEGIMREVRMLGLEKWKKKIGQMREERREGMEELRKEVRDKRMREGVERKKRGDECYEAKDILTD